MNGLLQLSANKYLWKSDHARRHQLSLKSQVWGFPGHISRADSQVQTGYTDSVASVKDSTGAKHSLVTLGQVRHSQRDPEHLRNVLCSFASSL